MLGSRPDEADCQRTRRRVSVDCGLHVECVFYSLRQQNLFRRSLHDYSSVAQQDQSIAIASRHIQIVDGHDGCKSIIDELPYAVEHLELMKYVQVGRWLVQQKNAGLLSQGACDEYPLTLPS